MITDKLYYKSLTEVTDLGYSDHFAQILRIKAKKPKIGRRKIKRRQLSSRNIQEFNHRLEMESSEDVFLYDDVNTSYNNFLNRCLHYFEIAFPQKAVYKEYYTKIKWITQGIKVSSQKMRILNILKKI
jgi:NAD-dependent DNA ligase